MTGRILSVPSWSKGRVLRWASTCGVATLGFSCLQPFGLLHSVASGMASPFYVPVIVAHEGVPAAHVWEAWRWGDGRVQWDSWDIVPLSCPGRDFKRAGARILKTIRRDFEGFWAWANSHAIPEETIMTMSAKAAHASNLEAGERSHNMTALTTYGVIAMCGWSCGARGTKANRGAARECLRGFVMAGLPDIHNTSLDFGELAQEASALCQVDADAQGILQPLLRLDQQGSCLVLRWTLPRQLV